MNIGEAGDVCGSKLGVSKTGNWLGCPVLVDEFVGVGGGPLIKLFAEGCLVVCKRAWLWCGCCVDGHSLLGLGICGIRGHLFVSRCADVCV